jgi:methyltransferase
VRLLTCGAMGGARLAELGYSRSNIQKSGDASEGLWSRRTYPLMVAVHGIAILGTLFFGRSRPNWGWLVLLAAVQPVRIWVLLTLGERWNTRAAVPTALEVETGGPYGFVRHPNYVVVAVELAALPLSFGLKRLALGVSLVNAGLLAIRIRDEEAALERLPGYREHFASKARFVPFMF